MRKLVKRATILKLVCLLCCLWIRDVLADARVCSQKEAIAAEEGSDKIKSWNDLYRAYSKYAHCDDGAISEGYSYSVTTLLTDRWESFPQLGVLTRRSSEFEDFVISHINETMSLSEADEILGNVTKKCPKETAKLCARIESAARLARTRI